MENSLFYAQFSPLNAGNHLLGFAILTFLREHAPRHPLKMWTVDTVGYSIENCRLLQFLLKPLNCYYNLLLQSNVLCSKPEGGFPLSRNFYLSPHLKFLCVNKTGNV